MNTFFAKHLNYQLMTNPYRTWLLILVALFSAALQVAVAKHATTTASCPIWGFGTISGPSVLNKTSQYSLVPKMTGDAINTTGISWSVSPASAVYIISSTTSPTLLLTPLSCDSVKAVITVTYLASYCGTWKPTTAQLSITVINSLPTVPVVSGTYRCLTCADTNPKTLQLDSNTNGVSRYGKYQIDLTSNNPSDQFVSWETFETAGATLSIIPGSNNRSVTIQLTPGASLAALAVNVRNNSCGKVRQIFRFSGQNATGSWVVSPNPVQDELIIDPVALPSPSPTPAPSPAPPTMDALVYSATLYDSHSSPVRSAPSTSQKVVFDVRSLPAGMYYLKVVGPNALYTKQIALTK